MNWKNRTPAMSLAVSSLVAHEYDLDTAHVAIPRPELQIIARFGRSIQNGLEAHAFGLQQAVHRKTIPAGQRVVSARLHPGAAAATFGVPARSLAGQIVKLDALWSASAMQRLYDQLIETQSNIEAADVLDGAISERIANAGTSAAFSPLSAMATVRLTSNSVSAVAAELGMSERQFRRVFSENIGVSPKRFARLARFRSALAAAQSGRGASWASIASECGYYDQAHLIDEFRAIAGVTPRALLGELRGVTI